MVVNLFVFGSCVLDHVPQFDLVHVSDYSNVTPTVCYLTMSFFCTHGQQKRWIKRGEIKHCDKGGR